MLHNLFDVIIFRTSLVVTVFKCCPPIDCFHFENFNESVLETFVCRVTLMDIRTTFLSDPTLEINDCIWNVF